MQRDAPRPQLRYPTRQHFHAVGHYEPQKTAHVAANNGLERGSGTDLLQYFLDFGVFRQKSPIQGDVFRRAFLKENQRIADVVGLIDGGGDLFPPSSSWRLYQCPAELQFGKQALFPPFMFGHSHFLQCGASRGSRALRDSEDQIMELLGGSSRSVGLLALLSAWAGRVPSVPGGDRLSRSLDPPNLGLNDRLYDRARQ